jgi:hypothetical protein
MPAIGLEFTIWQTSAIPSDDNVVRKVEIRVAQDRKVYSRSTSEVVLLVAKD